MTIFCFIFCPFKLIEESVIDLK